MATPIVVNPIKPSTVVVESNKKSGTPIKVTTDLDYTRVQAMIDYDTEPLRKKLEEVEQLAYAGL